MLFLVVLVLVAASSCSALRNITDEFFDFSKLKVEDHPILDPEQLSHSTLGYMYRYPIGSHCLMFGSNLVALEVSIMTITPINSALRAYECYATRTVETKTAWFFGTQTHELYEYPERIETDTCLAMTTTLVDPHHVPLTKITWQLYGTTRVPHTDFAWPGTETDTVYNYYVRLLNLTLDTETMIITAPQIDFIEQCHVNTSTCNTLRQGVVIWGENVQLPTNQTCQFQTLPMQTCILSNTSLHCPETYLLFNTLFQPSPCGRNIGMARASLTTNVTNANLTMSQEFFPLSSEFDLLINTTKFYDNDTPKMIIKQIHLCNFLKKKNSSILTILLFPWS